MAIQQNPISCSRNLAFLWFYALFVWSQPMLIGMFHQFYAIFWHPQNMNQGFTLVVTATTLNITMDQPTCNHNVIINNSHMASYTCLKTKLHLPKLNVIITLVAFLLHFQKMPGTNLSLRSSKFLTVLPSPSMQIAEYYYILSHSLFTNYPAILCHIHKLLTAWINKITNKQVLKNFPTKEKKS
jgi:hypothetical protein